MSDVMTGERTYIRVKIRGTGQVLDMVPDRALAMIAGGTAERVEKEKTVSEVLTAAIDKGAETASRAGAAMRRIVGGGS